MSDQSIFDGLNLETEPPNQLQQSQFNQTRRTDPDSILPSSMQEGQHSNLMKLLEVSGYEPEEGMEKVGATLALSNRLGMDPQFIWKNFDTVSEALTGHVAAPEHWTRALKNEYQRTRLAIELDQLAYNQMWGDDSEETQARIDEIMAEMPPASDVERGFLYKALAGMGNVAAFGVMGAEEGLPRAVAGAAGAASAAAAGGLPLVAGPQAALGAAPYASGVLAASAAGFGLGMKSGATEAFFEVGAGLVYNELLQIEGPNGEKIDPGTARNIAMGAAIPYTWLESLQLGSIPGASALVRNGIREGVVRSIMKGTFANTAARVIGGAAGGIAENVAQEVLQETTAVVAAEVAKVIEEQARGTEFETDAKGITERLATVARDSVATFTGVEALRGIVGIPRAYRRSRVDVNAQQNETQVAADETGVTEPQTQQDIETQLQDLNRREQEASQRFNEDPEAGARELIRIAQEREALQKQQRTRATRGDTERRQPWQMTAEEYRSTQDRRGWRDTEEADRWRAQVAERNPSYSAEEIEATLFLAEVTGAQMGVSPDQVISREFSDRIITTEGQQDQVTEQWVAAIQRREPDLSAEQARFKAENFVNGALGTAEDGRAIIQLSRNADDSTFIHEMGHVIRQRLAPELQLQAADLYGVADGQWAVEQEEEFARDFEEYIRTGEAKSQEHRSVFQKLSELIRRVYDSVVPGSSLTEERRALFDQIIERAPLEPQDVAKDTGATTIEGVAEGRDPFSFRASNLLVQATEGPGEAQQASTKAPVVEVPIQEIETSREVEQFKEGADERGVVEPLEARQYERLGTAPIVLWERADGTKEVITGRHRLDLAQRTGEETIPAQVVREADGFSREQAQRFDAESNIRDNQGTVRDYTMYFRGAEMSREDAEANGLLSRAPGRQGFAIGTYAGEGLYTAYRNQQIGAAKAAAIASGAPGDDAAQRAALQRKNDFNAEELHNFAKIVSERSDTSATQGDMFGDDDAAMQQAYVMAKRAASEMRAISDEISVLRKAQTVASDRRRETLQKYGNVDLNAEQIAARIGVLQDALARWGEWTTDSELAEWIRAGAEGENPALRQSQNDFVESPDQAVMFQEQSKPPDPEILFQTTAWHGSPYQFDRFSLEAIGTGEGAQAFGYGLYFTRNQDVARGYADALAHKAIHAPTGKIRNADYDPSADEAYVIGRIEQRMDVALTDWEDAANQVQEGLNTNQYLREESRQAFQTALESVREAVERGDLEFIGGGGPQRNLYNVTLNPGKDDVWLEWYSHTPIRIAKAVESQAEAEDIKSIAIAGTVWTQMEGREMYRDISRALGGPAEASKFLRRAGIDGIKYPVDSLSRGDTSYRKGANYVVFDDSKVQIEERILFQKAASQDIADIKTAIRTEIEHREEPSGLFLALRKQEGETDTQAKERIRQEEEHEAETFKKLSPYGTLFEHVVEQKRALFHLSTYPDETFRISLFDERGPAGHFVLRAKGSGVQSVTGEIHYLFNTGYRLSESYGPTFLELDEKNFKDSEIVEQPDGPEVLFQAFEDPELQAKYKSLAVESRENNVVPEGWWVHGRAGRQNLNTGFVFQFTKDWDVAEGFAGSRGSLWMARPVSGDRVFDATDYEGARRVAKQFFADYEKGTIEDQYSAGGLAERLLDNAGSREEAIDELAAAFNPEHIGDSAEFWDGDEALEWFYDTTGKDFVITEDGAVALSPDAIEAVKIPLSPDVLFQDQNPEHRKAVENAVSQGYYVPDQVLNEYADEWWAQQEIVARDAAREEARSFDEVEEFVEYMVSMDPDPKPEDWYREVYGSHDRTGVYSERNRRWADTLEKSHVEAMLLEAAHKDMIETLPHQILQSGAKRLRGGKGLSDEHFKKIMDQVNKYPAEYREAFAQITEDVDELRQMEEERALDPTAAELEEERRQRRQLAQENKKLANSYENLTEQLDGYKSRLRFFEDRLKKANEEVKQREAALDDLAKSARDEARRGTREVKAELREAIKSAKQEARQQSLESARQHRAELVEQKKSVEQETRLMFRYREQVQKQIRRIMRKPAGTIEYSYARQIEEIQSGLEVRISQERRKTQQKIQQLLGDSSPANAKAIVDAELGKQSLREMTPEELDALDQKIGALRDEGRRVRAEKIEKEREIRMDAVRQILTRLTGTTREPEQLSVVGSKEARKALQEGAIKGSYFATLRPERLFRMLDGNDTGPIYEWLWKEVNRATDDEIRATRDRLEIGEEQMKKLGITPKRLGEQITVDGRTLTRDQVIQLYAYTKDDRSVAAILARRGNNITEEQLTQFLDQLSIQDQAWGDWMMESFGDENFHKIQEVLIDVDNKGMEKVERYFPMPRQDAYGEFDGDVADRVLRDQGVGKAKVRKGFTISRITIGDRGQKPLRLDGATSVWQSQTAQQEKYVAQAKLFKRLNSIFLANREVKEAIAQKFGREMNDRIRRYINHITDPSFYNTHGNMANIMKAIRNNYAVAVLAYNLTTMAKQLPSTLLYLTETDPLHMIQGMAKFARNPKKAIEFVNSRDPQVRDRTMTRYMEELKSYDANAYERIVQKVGNVGFLGIAAMDRMAVTMGWRAVYDRYIDAGSSEEEAIQAAQTATLRTQPAARAKDLADMYRSGDGFKFFLMFSNQLNQIWNLTTYDLYDSVKRGNAAKTFGIVAAFTINAVAMGVIGRKRLFDADDDEPEEKAGTIGRDMLLQFFAGFPLFGSNITAGIQGWNFARGNDFFPFAYEVAAFSRMVANGDVDKTSVDDLVRMLESGGMLLGLPVIAQRRLRNVFLDDELQLNDFNLWELIGGPPEED